MTAIIDKPLTNLQLELLKLYSLNLSESQLIDIQRLIANYFANIASDEVDKLWDERGWSNETMDKWLKDENEENLPSQNL